MNALKWMALSAALLVGTSAFVVAEEAAKKDAPTAKEMPKKEKPKIIRLTKPWNLLSTLSDEQKSKIDSIHKSATEERKKVDEKEHDDIMALLNDDQKKELDAAIDKDKAARKAEAAKEKEGAKKDGEATHNASEHKEK